MREAKSTKLVRVEADYIFYTCLVLVLAIAVLGIGVDVLGR